MTAKMPALDDLDVIAHAWGLLLTSNGKLYGWNCDLHSPHIAWCVDVPAELRATVKDEIDVVSRDQFADWPTVDRLKKENLPTI